MAAVCPKCDQSLSYLRLEFISIRAAQQSWNGVAYLCPACGAILNAGIDPIALKADVVQETVDELMRRLGKH